MWHDAHAPAHARARAHAHAHSCKCMYPNMHMLGRHQAAEVPGGRALTPHRRGAASRGGLVHGQRALVAGSRPQVIRRRPGVGQAHAQLHEQRDAERARAVPRRVLRGSLLAPRATGLRCSSPKGCGARCAVGARRAAQSGRRGPMLGRSGCRPAPQAAPRYDATKTTPASLPPTMPQAQSCSIVLAWLGVWLLP